MRARQPDREGFVERDGVKVGYEVYGHGPATVFLVAASPITHARSWKGLVPFLSRHLTVVDDRRAGHRPLRPSASTAIATRPTEIVADLVEVLDVVDVQQAVVVAHCHAVPWALRLAADVPELVAGLVAISPGIAVMPGYEYAAEAERRWQDELVDASGWQHAQPRRLAQRRRLPGVGRVLLRPAPPGAALDQAARGRRGDGPWTPSPRR